MDAQLKNFIDKVPKIEAEAKKKAEALFMLDLREINNYIELAPDEKEVILKNVRQKAILSLLKSNYYDKKDISYEQLKLQIEFWYDIICDQAEGGHPFYKDVPKEFLSDPKKFVFDLIYNFAIQKNIIDYCNSQLNATPDQLKGLHCLKKYETIDLKFIYSKLMELNKLHKSVNETIFVGAFQGAILPEKIKWKGSNPELATLVHELTNETPEPLLIKNLFITATEYDSQSTKRINKKIINMIKSALK